MFEIHIRKIICLAFVLLCTGCNSRLETALPTESTENPVATPTPTIVSTIVTPPPAPAPIPTESLLPSPTTTAPAIPSPAPQSTSSVWQKVYRASGNEVVNDVLIADDGGYYLVGTKNLVFEPEQNGDVYLIRTDANGNKLWEKTYGGEGFDEGHTILSTNDGQLMIIGNTASFGTEGIDAYLIKVDRDGNELWSHTFGGPLDEMSGGTLLANGGFALGGNIVDPYDIVAPPGAAGYGGFAGRSNIFIAQTDSDGNPLWTQTFGGEQNVMTVTDLQASDGDYIILATIIAYPESGNHIYLLKVDENGQEIWSRTWEEDDAHGYAIVQTSDGGYLITGPYLPSGSAKEDYLFIKTDDEGNEVWRSTFGDPDMIDYGVVLTEAADGGYIAAGEWVRDYYSYDSDISVAKIDAHGQLVWQEKIETNAHHMLAGIWQHPDGGYIIATSIVSGNNFEFDIMLIKFAEPVP